MQTATIGDLAHFTDDPVHGLERAARDPGAHQDGGDQPDRHDQQQRGQQLGDRQLRGADVGGDEQRAEARPGPAHDVRHVAELGSVGLEPHGAGHAPREGRRHQRAQLHDLLVGERRVGGRVEDLAVLGRDQQVVGNRLQHGFDVRHERRLARRVVRDERAARPVALPQNRGGELRLGPDALVQILVGGPPARHVQHDRERGKREHQRGRIPHRETTADRLHVTPSRRSPRRARCESASARPRDRSSCGAA